MNEGRKQFSDIGMSAHFQISVVHFRISENEFPISEIHFPISEIPLFLYQILFLDVVNSFSDVKKLIICHTILKIGQCLIK